MLKLFYDRGNVPFLCGASDFYGWLAEKKLLTFDCEVFYEVKIVHLEFLT